MFRLDMFILMIVYIITFLILIVAYIGATIVAVKSIYKRIPRLEKKYKLSYLYESTVTIAMLFFTGYLFLMIKIMSWFISETHLFDYL